MRTPRIAIVGFGMAGVGASRALRHHRALADTPADFAPQITVLEGAPRVGGKAAPRNVGAQFVDSERFYPIDRLIGEHRLETHPAREDYELVHMRLKNGTVLDAEDFRVALEVVRRELLAQLTPEEAPALDDVGLMQFLDRLEKRGLLDADGVAAMRARARLEEGKTELSSLYYALTFAKSETPMQRREIVGGVHAIPLAEKLVLERSGARVLVGARAIEVRVRGPVVRVVWQRGEDDATDMGEFDAAILALSPEHLVPKRLRVIGAPMPLAVVSRLAPARITKSNLTLHAPVRAEEHATERYALWRSHQRQAHEVVLTFFHGWEGQTPLSLWQMLRVAVGHPDPTRLLRMESETWDGHAEGDEIPAAYITQPAPGQTRPLLRLARAQYFGDTYAGSPLRVANHTLGVGGTVRDAAMAGERAVISLLRGWGYDTRPAWRHFEDPEAAFFGVGGATLDALTR